MTTPSSPARGYLNPEMKPLPGTFLNTARVQWFHLFPCPRGAEKMPHKTIPTE